MTAVDGEQQLRAFARRFRNWGRWGADDQRGAVNLIDPPKVRESVALASLGVRVSLSRNISSVPALNNARPANLFFRSVTHSPSTAGMVDYLGLECHGYETTHVDALSHLWDDDGMWNGRNSDAEVGFDGARWGGIENWSDGLVTRGVLLDVANHRPEGHVTNGKPVTGDELERLVAELGLVVRPGDALVIHSGRERWEEASGRPWGSLNADGAVERPGLDASCLAFFHSVDCAMVVWDMMDVKPNQFGTANGPHVAIHTQGIALVDNAALHPLSAACTENARYDFLLVVAPLVIPGGSGSAVNPIAIL